jgi:hypothetical protein
VPRVWQFWVEFSNDVTGGTVKHDDLIGQRQGLVHVMGY